MKIRKYLMIASFAAGVFTFSSCQDNNRQNDTETVDLENYDNDQNRMDQERMERRNNSISSRIQDDQELSTFSQGMTRAELDDDFREGEGPYTIFAPSNVAYDELSQEERNQFENIDNERAGAGMHYLAIEEELTSDQLRQEIQNANGNYSLTTMQGEQLTASLEGDNIVLRDGSGNTATITETDRDASNGIVHVIDGILKPQDDSQSQAQNKDWNDRNDQMNFEQGDDRENRANLDTGTNNTSGNTTGNNNSGNTTGNNNQNNNDQNNNNQNNNNGTGNNQ